MKAVTFVGMLNTTQDIQLCKELLRTGRAPKPLEAGHQAATDADFRLSFCGRSCPELESYISRFQAMTQVELLLGLCE